MKIFYLIPARKDSKGFPEKNRKLFKYTAETIRNLDNVYVSSNDIVIKSLSETYNFNFHKRSEKNASDTATTKDFVEEFAKDLKLEKEDIVVMLMLTYPERTKNKIDEALDFFIRQKCKSMLCRKEINNTPFLMMFEEKNFKGTQVIKHDLCRRQDYRKVFEISHFISIFKVGEVENLNNNLYNKDTIFYQISDKIVDVDTKNDMERFNESNKNYS